MLNRILFVRTSRIYLQLLSPPLFVSVLNLDSSQWSGAARPVAGVKDDFLWWL